MQTDFDHNKVIKRIVNATHKPQGLFQKGASRVWIDDNWWYLIMVEFQPSAWSKGSYLNVGIHYLWDEKDYLSFDYGHRLHEFVSFDGNEGEFAADMESLANQAMNQVAQYRSFRNLEHARVSVLQNEAHHIVNTLYPKMMICGLCKDADAGSYFAQLMEKLPMFADVKWTRKYYLELHEKIAPLIDDEELFYQYICSKIESQRNFWKAKSSMRKLRDTFTV